MSHSSDHADMTMARVQQLLDAYGAMPSHWPQEEREHALRLLARSSQAALALQRAAQLDDLLNQVKPLTPSPQLLASVLADARSLSGRSWGDSFWPFGSLWQPVGVMACAVMLGLVLGIQSPEPWVVAGENPAIMAEELVQLAYGVDWDGGEGE